MITVCTMIMETGHPKTYSCRELMISSNATGITFVIVDVVTVQIDEKTRKELDEVAAELGESASEVIQKAIHLAWFAAMQDKMRRESAEIASDPTEIASDPTERDEAELMRQCARYLAS